MSHTNEKGMVVGKRYMLTSESQWAFQFYIAILKYYNHLEPDVYYPSSPRGRDEWTLECVYNMAAGWRADDRTKKDYPIKPIQISDFTPIKYIIDMEEIDLEYSKLKLAFANGLNDEISLIHDLPHDLIESIGEKLKELYFEICLKIYNRLTGKLVRVTHNKLKNGGGKKNKRKTKKRKRRKSKKKKSKTLRRRR